MICIKALFSIEARKINAKTEKALIGIIFLIIIHFNLFSIGCKTRANMFRQSTKVRAIAVIKIAFSANLLYWLLKKFQRLNSKEAGREPGTFSCWLTAPAVSGAFSWIFGWVNGISVSDSEIGVGGIGAEGIMSATKGDGRIGAT